MSALSSTVRIPARAIFYYADSRDLSPGLALVPLAKHLQTCRPVEFSPHGTLYFTFTHSYLGNTVK